MRIISGMMKGRKLVAPPGLNMRPTSDKVKGAIYNILSDRIIMASFLDLYAGSGSVGIEGLSRGARQVVFVDQDRRHLHYIRKNIPKGPFEGRYQIIQKSASDFLITTKQSFDFIFIDPPYVSEELEKILPRLIQGDIIAEDGEIIIEHHRKKPLPENIGAFLLIKEYKYGETLLSLYGRK
ncbi:MAG: 16S rRNA (guanine(966)-N(2))-methyltransferase RsmD [Nitrospira sp.]